MGETQPFPGGGRSHHALIVDGHDGVDAPVTIELLDDVGGGRGIVERNGEGAIAGGVDGGLLRSDHELDAQGLGGPDEVRRPIRGGGHKEEDPGHGSYHGAHD